MPFYTNRGWGSMHWACVECLVRPMCAQRCDKTYLKHWKCENCDGRGCMDKGFPCKTVERYQMYETVEKAYGHLLPQMIKQLNESSTIARLSRFVIANKSTFNRNKL
jgi:hypothetical protein